VGRLLISPPREQSNPGREFHGRMTMHSYDPFTLLFCLATRALNELRTATGSADVLKAVMRCWLWRQDQLHRLQRRFPAPVGRLCPSGRWGELSPPNLDDPQVA
jgi:hypothetical protein